MSSPGHGCCAAMVEFADWQAARRLGLRPGRPGSSEPLPTAVLRTISSFVDELSFACQYKLDHKIGEGDLAEVWVASHRWLTTTERSPKSQSLRRLSSKYAVMGASDQVEETDARGGDAGGAGGAGSGPAVSAAGLLRAGSDVSLLYARVPRTYAVKAISTVRLSSAGLDANDAVQALRRQITVRHETLANVEALVVEPSMCFVVMQHLRGGDVLDAIVRQPREDFSEAVVAGVVKRIAESLEVLHAAGFALGIIHKEHFRYASHSPTAPLVCLALTAPIHLRQDDEGSPARAPELLFDDGVSTPFGASDVWCLGVLLFTLIRGFSPFEEDNEVRMMRRIRGAKVDYEGWEATPEALDLVKRMLVADPNERATVAEVLSHEWITRNRDEQAAALLHGTVERLAKLDVRRRMRAGVNAIRSALRIGFVSSGAATAFEADVVAASYAETARKAFLKPSQRGERGGPGALDTDADRRAGSPSQGHLQLSALLFSPHHPSHKATLSGAPPAPHVARNALSAAGTPLAAQPRTPGVHVTFAETPRVGDEEGAEEVDPDVDEMEELLPWLRARMARYFTASEERMDALGGAAASLQLDADGLAAAAGSKAQKATVLASALADAVFLNGA